MNGGARAFLRRACRMPLLLGMLALAGCGEPAHDVLRFGLASAPVTLDPRFATDAASERINRLLYRALVDFDDHFQPRPALAEWEQLSPLHYRFHLRAQGREFHDGSPLTARDVKATYESILDPATASPHRASLAVIQRVVASDENTVDFFLTKSDSLFPGRLTTGILSAARIAEGHPFNVRPLGSGPFVFEAWPNEGRLRLARRADGQRFEFLRVRDPTVRVLKLLRGEIDMLQNDLPPELVNYAQRQPELYVLRGRGSNFSYLGFNMRDEVTAKLAVRRAIAHALDREAIIHYALGGGARTAEALLPPHHWAGAPDLPAYAHDTVQARALLREAGYDDTRRPRIVYKTSNDPFRVRLATIIQQQLNEAGFEVEVQTFDWGTFYGDIKTGRFQMYSLAWIGVKMPDIFHYAFHSKSVPPEGANRGRYADSAADALIEAADARIDPVRQAEGYREVEAYLLRTLPYVPLWYEDHVFIARRGVVGYTISPDGNYDGLEKVRVESSE